MEDNDRRPSDKLVLRDLYEQYWRCRDFEIKNLWQRSIFLGAFLILCFTGYGAFFSKAFFDKDNQLIYFDEECWKCHIFAMLIALLGVVFSRLWICLAKASKAWVEVYETAIRAIEKKLSKNNILKNYIAFQYDNLPFYPQKGKHKFDTSLHSFKGGAFSPSRINIIIGYVALWAMSLSFANHCVMLQILKYPCHLIWSVILCFILLVLCLRDGTFRLIKSDTLKNKDPEAKWIDERTLIKLYKNEYLLLEKIKSRLSVLNFVDASKASFGSEGEYVYLTYNFIYEENEMKLDIFVEKINFKRVFTEIKSKTSRDVLYKTNVKGEYLFEKKCFLLLKKTRNKKLDEDKLVNDVVARLKKDIFDKKDLYRFFQKNKGKS